MTQFEKIYLFNSLIGQNPAQAGTEEFFNQVSNQTSLILEEVNETLDAAINRDLVEVIDGVSDIMVTAIGLYQKLQLSGVDIGEALHQVCDNNLKKFHRDPEEANKTVKFYQDQGVETFVRFHKMEDGSEYFAVIRKEDGKLMKPYDFEPVDLSNIVVIDNGAK